MKKNTEKENNSNSGIYYDNEDLEFEDEQLNLEEEEDNKKKNILEQEINFMMRIPLIELQL